MHHGIEKNVRWFLQLSRSFYSFIATQTVLNDKTSSISSATNINLRAVYKFFLRLRFRLQSTVARWTRFLIRKIPETPKYIKYRSVLQQNGKRDTVS